jgi:hypothetical protein
MQNNTVLVDELTAILGGGRFKSLLKHLRTHFASLRAAARQQHRLSHPASAVEKATQHEQCCSVEDDEESLRCDELVAEIEQRVTQLENVLTRYNSRYIRTGPLGSKLFLTSKIKYLNQPKREKVYLI